MKEEIDRTCFFVGNSDIDNDAWDSVVVVSFHSDSVRVRVNGVCRIRFRSETEGVQLNREIKRIRVCLLAVGESE